MPIFSTIRAKRFSDQNQQQTQQVIAFRLSQEWFALPILAIHKVVPLGKIYGDPQQTGVSLTSYEGTEILVIDVAKQIFNQGRERTRSSKEISLAKKTSTLASPRYLVAIQTEQQNIIGLPTDSQPDILRISESDFKPLPEAYLQQGNIKCVSSQVIDLPDFALVFLLDPQQLIVNVP